VAKKKKEKVKAAKKKKEKVKAAKKKKEKVSDVGSGVLK
jgi:hypothetical protein